MELLNGTGRTLAADTATIKAFALDIITQRRQQLAAAATARANANAKADSQKAGHTNSPTEPADAGTGISRDQDSTNSANGGNIATGGSSAAGEGGGVGVSVGGGGEREEEEEAAQDLLSLFMAASGPDGKPLTTQQLVDTVINFIIAGRDTTAQVGGGGGRGVGEACGSDGVHLQLDSCCNQACRRCKLWHIACPIPWLC